MPTVTVPDSTSAEFLDSVEEFRVLARAAEGRRRRREGGPRLPNGARMAKLHAIAHNPYIDAAFSSMSTLEMMRMCANQLSAQTQYKSAGALFNQIAHHENVRAAMAERKAAKAPPDQPAQDPPTPDPIPDPPAVQDPDHDPDPDPDPDPRQLALAIPEPVDPPRRRRTAWQVFVAGLTDRELAHFLAIEQHEQRHPPNGPRLKERLMPYLEARGLHDPP